MSDLLHPRPAPLVAWQRFLEVHSIVTALLDDELQAEHSLPLPWYDVLVQLSEADGRRTMSDLADAVLLSRSNCTRLVDRMERDGLVIRQADAGDARVRWAVMTAAGRKALDAAAPLHLDGIERYFTSALSDADAKRFTDRFDTMIEAARAERAGRSA